MAPAECAAPPLDALRREAVDDLHHTAATLFTWTTREQLDGLRRGGALLTRATSPTGGASVYDRVVAYHAANGDRGAAVLAAGRFRRARFAWTTPWPTLRGWAGEAYGDQLVRVTLRPEAWVLRLWPWGHPVEARSLDGAVVPIDEVVAHPERVGAVYFVQDAGAMLGSMIGGEAVEAGRFREFVLPNEGMIASWEFGTPATSDALDASVALLTALRAWVAQCPPGAARGFPDANAWRLADDGGLLRNAWSRALAIASPRYALDLPTLDALLAALRDVPREPGRVVTNRPGARRPVLDPQARP